MKVLIAEDDYISRGIIEATLVKWGYDVIVARDGMEAWQVLQSNEPPPLAILDWMMPGMDGVEVCRKVRQTPNRTPPYLILLTAKSHREDLVAGLQAGADDYVIKPFNREELRARVQVGVRLVTLQQRLANHVRELEEAFSRMRLLQGLLPICGYCKNIRHDRHYWQQVERYIAEHGEALVGCDLCPDCSEAAMRPSRP